MSRIRPTLEKLRSDGEIVGYSVGSNSMVRIVDKWGSAYVAIPQGDGVYMLHRLSGSDLCSIKRSWIAIDPDRVERIIQDLNSEESDRAFSYGWIENQPPERVSQLKEFVGSEDLVEEIYLPLRKRNTQWNSKTRY